MFAYEETDKRVTLNQKHSVHCPACGAEPGFPCVSRRYLNRWRGMPTLDEPHRERRNAWIAQEQGDPIDVETGPVNGRKYYLRHPTEADHLVSGYTHLEMYPTAQTPIEFGKTPVYGVVVYPAPVNPVDAWADGLIPADPAENGLQIFIDRAAGDIELAEARLDRYRERGEAVLLEQAETDRLARAALPIIQNDLHFVLDLLASTAYY